MGRGDGRCLRVFEGHTQLVRAVAWSADQRRVLSGSDDKTVRLWDVETGAACVCSKATRTGSDALRGAPTTASPSPVLMDTTVRLWDVETGRCLRVLEGHANGVMTWRGAPIDAHAFSGDAKCGIRVWDLSEFVTEARAAESHRASLAVRAGPGPIHERQSPPRRRYWSWQERLGRATGSQAIRSDEILPRPQGVCSRKQRS